MVNMDPGRQIDPVSHLLNRGDVKAAARIQAEEIQWLRSFFRIFSRLLIFPIWLAVVLWLKQRRKRQMVEFTRALTVKGITGPRELALEWIATHPDQYPWGEYDPTLPKLQETFRKILARRNPAFS